uniref:Uncharacterized protein n=1 Tax=Arundo donax TaxID=35708 RepID=A0A0A8ZK51_ARUDO
MYLCSINMHADYIPYVFTWLPVDEALLP